MKITDQVREHVSIDDYQNEKYSILLEYFLGKADVFQMVIRTDIDFKSDDTYGYSDSAYQFIQELKPFIFEEKQSKRWLASSTFGSPAIVYKGRFNQDSLMIILKYTNKISDWQGPDNPDDLSLMNGNSPRLSFIGHEKIGFYFLNSEEASILVNRYGFSGIVIH